MIDRIIAAVLEHFGFTEEHANKVKKFLAMVEWEEDGDKKVAVIRPGDGIEIRIVQPDKNDDEDESGMVPPVA